MSKLFATERGFVVPSLGEELTDRRRARKVIELPATSSPAIVYVLAASHAGNERPLRIRVGHIELAAVAPVGADYRWYTLDVPVEALRAGPNTIELWCDGEAMDGWALGVEYGGTSTSSFVSMNGGETWLSERIGHLNTGRGEYLVRVRLREYSDPAPPTFIPGRTDDPGASLLRARLPGDFRTRGETLERVRALATWTSTSWRYRNTTTAAQHAPWDPLTILAWGKAGVGHNRRIPVVMCVQYGIVFVAACAALGIPARPAVFAEYVNGPGGHFAAEVWLHDLGRWILVDPNEDALFFDGDLPMTVEQVQAAGADLGRYVQWGPGHNFQTRVTSMRQWIAEEYLTGRCLRHRGVWPRSDFGRHPELTPPSHGETGLSELDLVWGTDDVDRGFGMFRYFADSTWFNAPP